MVLGGWKGIGRQGVTYAVVNEADSIDLYRTNICIILETAAELISRKGAKTQSKRGRMVVVLSRVKSLSI